MVTGNGILEKISAAHIQDSNSCRMAPWPLKLEYGKNYVRHPILFYRDGFEKDNSPYTKDLLSDVYIQPFECSPKTQSLSSSARVV